MDIKNRQNLLIEKILITFLIGILAMGYLQANVNSTKYEIEKDCGNYGCLFENECYPYGHRINTYEGDKIDDQYCAYKFVVKYPDGKMRYSDKNKFIKQSKTGTECNNNFECLTNYCLNELCVNQTETEKKLEKLNKEMEQEIIELSNKINDMSKKLDKLDKLNKTTYSVDEENFPIKRNNIQKIYDWFKKFFH